ncbi:MAG: LytTR family transcriptional regulator DNA-binding domain-containing protein [bacterium]|nr:LytTR family transcriptional regulator DNA-binding domain-containing protein [bacterium]
MIVFEPFGISRMDCAWGTWILAGLSIPIFLTLAFNFYIVGRLLPVFFNENTWSIGKEAVWSVFNFLTIVGTTGIYWMVIPVCGTTSLHWGEQMLRAFWIGILPGMVCIYFNYNRALKLKLKKSQSLNQKLQSKVSYYEHGWIKLMGENNSEVLNLNTNELILIQSYDNYAKVITHRDDEISIHILRSSLKNLQSQIDTQFIIRGHRSYIINLSKIDQVKGNARDFRVKLKGYKDWIPISREAYKTMNALFEDFNPKANIPISFSFGRSSSR